MSKSKSSVPVKGKTVFYWLAALVIIAISIAVAFRFDEPMRQWMLEHQNPTTRTFMENVSRFGDWPEHVLVGLGLMALAQWRGNKKWTRIFLAMLIVVSLRALPIDRPPARQKAISQIPPNTGTAPIRSVG